MSKKNHNLPIELTPGQKRAKTVMARDPDYYKKLGRRGGKTAQELHPYIARFRDRDVARKASQKGLEERRRRKNEA